jgi:alpha-N-acetylglucosamine transferase
VFLFFVYAPLPEDVHKYRDAAVQSAADSVPKAWRPYSSHEQEEQSTAVDNSPKYAYATFLAGNTNEDAEDVYYLGARLLAYQLIHAPETRSNNSIPFLVMVTNTVSEAKKKQLRKDGAEVVVVEDLISPWIGDPRNNPRFKDVMTKLRLWEMTQYDRICLLDGDMVLMDNIDGVFDDPAVKTRASLNKTDAIKADEAPQPSEYAFASTAEPSTFLFPHTQRLNQVCKTLTSMYSEYDHDFPPSVEKHQYQFGPNYLNSGFIVLQPSADMFAYYVSLLDKSDGRWGEGLPEQNLLNWAHRRPKGNMPWQTLDKMWNIHFPTVQDMEAGVKSLHEKFWNPEHKDLRPYLEKWKWRMLQFFEEREKTTGRV